MSKSVSDLFAEESDEALDFVPKESDVPLQSTSEQLNAMLNLGFFFQFFQFSSSFFVYQKTNWMNHQLNKSRRLILLCKLQ